MVVINPGYMVSVSTTCQAIQKLDIRAGQFSNALNRKGYIKKVGRHSTASGCLAAANRALADEKSSRSSRLICGCSMSAGVSPKSSSSHNSSRKSRSRRVIRVSAGCATGLLMRILPLLLRLPCSMWLRHSSRLHRRMSRRPIDASPLAQACQVNTNNVTKLHNYKHVDIHKNLIER